MNFVRRGHGKPLLLAHGLGGSWRSWEPILNSLAKHREVIAVDLPGHGSSPPLPGPHSVKTLADALARFLKEMDLAGIDAAGCSMGGRLVLELARRGNILGAVVALDPDGFWKGWQRHFFYGSMYLCIRLLRGLKPLLPGLARHNISRVLLLKQFATYPWRLSPRIVEQELQSLASCPVFDEVLWELAYGEAPKGTLRHSMPHPLVIGWGDRDRVCFSSESQKALDLFPDAQFYGFHPCGHFPQWEAPQDVVHLILSATAEADEDADAFKARGVSIPRRSLTAA